MLINILTNRVRKYLSPNTLDHEKRSLFLICISLITSELSMFSSCFPKDYQDGYEQISEWSIVKGMLFRSQSCTICSQGTQRMITIKGQEYI